MALSKDEWRRRIGAACELHGIDLQDLEDLDGFRPKDAARKAGHPSDKYQPNHALALVLAEKLELPVAWFEDEDWRPLIREEERVPVALAEGLKRQKHQLEMLRETVTALARIEKSLDHLEAQAEPIEVVPPATLAGLEAAVSELNEELVAIRRDLKDARTTPSPAEEEPANGQR